MPTPSQIIIRIPGPPVRPAPSRPRADPRRIVVAYARLVALRERRMGINNHGRPWRQSWLPDALYRNDYALARKHLARVISLYGAKTIGRNQNFVDINCIIVPKY